MMKLPRRKLLHWQQAQPHCQPSRAMHMRTLTVAAVRTIVAFPAAARRTSSRGLPPNGCRSGWVSNSSSKTGPAPAAISAPRPRFVSEPDGYTILVDVLTNVLNVSLYQHLNFDFVRDIAPVGTIANAPYVVLITNSLPVATVPEFIAYAKANPGKINYASGGIGTSSHIFGALLTMMAGIDMVHVPYRTNYMTDLIGGQCRPWSTQFRSRWNSSKPAKCARWR